MTERKLPKMKRINFKLEFVADTPSKMELMADICELIRARGYKSAKRKLRETK